MTITTHEKAVQLREALKLVNEARIPVLSRDPMLRLKERAQMTRALFKSLGLKGISVAVADGANCFYVVIRLPNMQHHHNREHTDCEACIYLSRAELALEEILQRAFPKEVDNSDPQSDYFDFPWFFHYYT